MQRPSSSTLIAVLAALVVPSPAWKTCATDDDCDGDEKHCFTVPPDPFSYDVLNSTQNGQEEERGSGQGDGLLPSPPPGLLPSPPPPFPAMPGSKCVVCTKDDHCGWANFCVTPTTPNLEFKDKQEYTCQCFSGASTVQVKDKGNKTMAELMVGDWVLGANGVYTQVFMFTHVEKGKHTDFFEISTVCGKSLTVTGGHYLPVGENKELRAARTVLKGESVALGDGSMATVAAVSKVIGQGVYTPQTTTGDIVVDGVLASCHTEHFPLAVQRAAMTALHLMYETFGLGWFGANADDGIPASVRKASLFMFGA